MDPETFQAMRLSFLREVAALVPRVSAQLDLLRTDPTHAEAIEEIRLFFHRIAGTAASIELEDLGRVARICERVVTVTQLGDERLRPYLHAIVLDGHKLVSRMLQEAAAG